MTKPWGQWKKKTRNPWLKRIWRRVYRRNQNWLCIGHGGTGTGKSYTALELCDLLDPNFTVDNVVFDALELIELVQSGKIRPGSAVLFEELGVAANARDWYTNENKALSNVTQVFRTYNLIVIYTVPRLGLVDKQIAPLAHAHFKAMGVDFKKKQNVIKVYDPVEYDEKKNKWHTLHPAFKMGLKTVKMKFVRLKKVRSQLSRAYEKKREQYLAGLTNRAYQEIEQSRQLKSKRLMFTDEQLKEAVDGVVRNREKYVLHNGTRFDKEAVMRDFKVGSANAMKIKSAATQRFKDLGFDVQYR